MALIATLSQISACSLPIQPDLGAPPLWVLAGPCSDDRVDPQATIACRRVATNPALLRSQPDALSLILPKWGAVIVRKAVIAVEGDRGSAGWIGVIDGDPYSSVEFAVVRESVSGRIVSSDGRLYRLRGSVADGPIIELLDRNAFPREIPPGLPPLPEVYETRPPLREEPRESSRLQIANPCSSAGSALICVLVAYTPAAAAEYQTEDDLLAAIDLEVIATNQSYVNSKLRQRIVLAAARKVDYFETGDRKLDMSRLLIDGDQYLDDVHDARDEVRADVVVLVTNYAEIGSGAADQFGAGDVGNSNFAWKAFAIVPQRVLGIERYSFAHELGHLMGAAHDGMAMGGFPPGPDCYSHGHIDPVPTGEDPLNPGKPCRPWKTLMSGSDYCPDCVRKLYWSSGDESVAYCDRPVGNSYTEDNARTLNGTASTIAAFR